MHLQKHSDFIALKPRFSSGIWLLKNARFPACFFLVDANWALMVHIVVAQVENPPQNKRTSETIFSARIWVLVVLGSVGPFLGWGLGWFFSFDCCSSSCYCSCYYVVLGLFWWFIVFVYLLLICGCWFVVVDLLLICCWCVVDLLLICCWFVVVDLLVIFLGLFFCSFCFSCFGGRVYGSIFFCFLFKREKTVPPIKTGHFCLFSECLPWFLPSFFHPLFHSLSISSYYLCFFLPCFYDLIFYLFIGRMIRYMKQDNMKKWMRKNKKYTQKLQNTKNVKQ